MQTANDGAAAQKHSVNTEVNRVAKDIIRQLEEQMQQMKPEAKKNFIKELKKSIVKWGNSKVNYFTDKLDSIADTVKSKVIKTRKTLARVPVSIDPARWWGGKTKKSKKQNKYTKKEKKKINGVMKVIYRKKNSKKLYVKSKGRMINLKKYKKR